MISRAFRPLARAIGGNLVLTGMFATTAALAQDPGQAPPPRQVGVVEMQLQDVPRVVTLPGRAVASEQALIRPRVSGMITEILYQPGTLLQPGSPMFRLDATTYEANVISAEANVLSARAATTQAVSAYERVSRLQSSGSTRADLETAQSNMEQAQARLKAAEAALDIAQAELGWTVVTSPVSGMSSVADVSVGDLVTANQGQAMATVTRLDPIEVDMYEPSVRIQRLYGEIGAGRLKLNETLRATLTLETGETYAAVGELLAPGFTVSTTTGAVDNRYRFQNPDHRLLPGMFLRGQIELGTSKAFLVSQSAATRDRTGAMTVWVVENGAAVQRSVVDDGSHDGSWIVTQGLNPGDQVIVDSFTGLAPGTPVAPVPATFTAQGVASDAAAPAAAATPEAAPAATPEAAPAGTETETKAE